MCVWMHTHAHTCIQVPAKALGPLDLEFQVVVNYPVWSWELNPGPLKERMLTAIEPSCQAPHHPFKKPVSETW